MPKMFHHLFAQTKNDHASSKSAAELCGLSIFCLTISSWILSTLQKISWGTLTPQHCGNWWQNMTLVQFERRTKHDVFWCFQLLVFLLNLLEGIDGWSMHILETLSFQGSPSCWERLGDFSQCHQNVDLKFFRPARKQNIERSYHFILRQQVTVNQTCHVAEFTKFIGACTTSLKTLLVALGKVVDNLMSFCGNPEMPTTRQHCQLGHSTTLPTWTFDPCLKNWTPTCLKLGTLRWLWGMPIVRGRKNQEIEPLPVWNC